MGWVFVIGLIAWFFFGSPPKDVANFLWSDGAAPWENVDPIYYPNANDLTKDQSGPRVTTVAECRDWVYAEAARQNDPRLVRGDYECGVGFIESWGGLRVYRITVR